MPSTKLRLQYNISVTNWMRSRFVDSSIPLNYLFHPRSLYATRTLPLRPKIRTWPTALHSLSLTRNKTKKSGSQNRSNDLPYCQRDRSGEKRYWPEISTLYLSTLWVKIDLIVADALFFTIFFTAFFSIRKWLVIAKRDLTLLMWEIVKYTKTYPSWSIFGTIRRPFFSRWLSVWADQRTEFWLLRNWLSQQRFHTFFFFFFVSICMQTVGYDAVGDCRSRHKRLRTNCDVIDAAVKISWNPQIFQGSLDICIWNPNSF